MSSPGVTAHLRDTGTPPIPEAKGWLAAYGGGRGPAIDLSQAAPAYAPPPALMQALAEAAGDPATAAYGAIHGEPGLRDIYAAEISRMYGATVPSAATAIVAGCNEAFVMAAIAIAAAGDEIILPSPWYFNHKMALDMLGIHARPLPCRPEDGFVPSAAAAAELINERTRAIVLVTPNNPTGSIYPPAMIAGFSRLAAERGLWLILDETYRDFLPAAGSRPHDLFAEAGGLPDHVIQLYSFSKSFAVPGYRLGAVVAPASFMEPFGKVLDTLQICAPRIGQIAVARAMPLLGGWREENRAMIAARGAMFRSIMAQAEGWTVGSVGAYFAYASPPEQLGAAEDVSRKLAQEAGVLMLPGRYFGPGQERWLRVAFANVDNDRLEELPDRLKAL
ncbi:MAG: aminotransferase [Beijerinckiaceae bacterium]